MGKETDGLLNDWNSILSKIQLRIEEQSDAKRAVLIQYAATNPKAVDFEARFLECFGELFDVHGHYLHFTVLDNAGVAGFLELLNQAKALLTKEAEEIVLALPAHMRKLFLSKLSLLFSARFFHWKSEAMKRVRTQRPDTLEHSARIGRSDRNTQREEKIANLTAKRSAFPRRALWLEERLRERGWSSSDPGTQHHGPDRKTVEKILRGEKVTSESLLKLSKSLSQKHSTVRALDIPND